MSTDQRPYPSRATWLSTRAGRSPTATCLWWRRSSVSFAALQKSVDCVGARLWAAGLRPGERLATVCAPSLRFVELFHATQSVGAVLVPLGPRLTSREITPLIERANPCLVLSDAASIPTVRAAAATSRSINNEVSVVEALDELDTIAPAQPASLAADITQAEDPFTILFTSGTSGAPKAAVLSYGAHEASARAGAKRLVLSEHDCWLGCMPLHHVGGISILVRSVVCGVPFVLCESFDAATVNRELDAGLVTAISVVPTMLKRLLESRNGRAFPDSLRLVLTGGGPLDAGLAARARSLNAPVVATYGLTEAASQVCTVVPGNIPAEPGCVGSPLRGTGVTIDKPGVDGVGEILVSGPTLMNGYFDDPAATRAALCGGELHTGDLGRLDGEGRLHIECRRTDLIVTGGENVYPVEVEAVLCEHPEVSAAVVVATDDPEWGQEVGALVVLSAPLTTDQTVERSGFEAQEDLRKRIRDFCSTRLAAYKIPRRFVFIDSLPLTPAAKIDRNRVKALLLFS